METAINIGIEDSSPPPSAQFLTAMAMGGSFLLHAGIAAGLFILVAPVAAPPQPIPVEIIMAAAPQPTPAQEKPVKAEPDEAAILPKSAPKPIETKPALPALQKSAEKKDGADERIIQSHFNATYLRNPPPDYPAAAKRDNIEGSVLLKVDVSENGNALSLAVEKSSGSSLLDNAARDAVKQWRFLPAHRNGHPIAAAVMVPVIFRLE